MSCRAASGGQVGCSPLLLDVVGVAPAASLHVILLLIDSPTGTILALETCSSPGERSAPACLKVDGACAGSSRPMPQDAHNVLNSALRLDVMQRAQHSQHLTTQMRL